MRVVGEVVGIMGDEIRDHRGRLIGYETVDFRAVVVPEGSDLRPGTDDVITFVTTTMKLLIPNGWEVPAELVSGAAVIVRETTYYVDGDVVVHRSPFGTTTGGIEIALSTTPVS